MGRSGKRVNTGGLGKALVRTQKNYSTTNTRDVASSAGKHVSERDGGDASNALASYLEGSSLDDFLTNAVMANRDFTANRDNVKLINDGPDGPTLVEKYGNHVPEMTFAELKVPRRPAWTPSMSAEELNQREKESFLEWRREIAEREQSRDDVQVTPFEKNLEVWRQLWHVRERSDILVQIVDARNPLFYRSEDLEAYAKEGEFKRRTMLIVNKSDYLDDRQREAWGDYFSNETTDIIFFSAKKSQEEIDAAYKQLEDEDEEEQVVQPVESTSAVDSKYPLFSREELLDYMTQIAGETLGQVGIREKDNGLIKFGMVGFPNVGKSSVINALLGTSTYSHKTKRVAVGATPGKTKHFQTMILSDRIMLCDCPGLVFPSFVSSKAEMYCCGVLPIAQLRDHVGPCELMCLRIPKRVFERTYGIKIQIPVTSKETDPVDVYTLLEAYAMHRGYKTTGKGGADTSRAARDLLRDYVKGKLLYCHPPPETADPDAFDIHRLAKEKFPSDEPILESVEEDEEDVEEMEAFETVEEKAGVSKRLKRHGRKGRKGRDKNPYEDSEFAGGNPTVHINSAGSRKRFNKKDAKRNK